MNKSQKMSLRARIWNAERRKKHFVENQRKLWWKLKRHFNHIEYFDSNGREYRFDGTNVDIV